MRSNIFIPVLAIIASFQICEIRPSWSQERGCHCNFAEPPWEAHGTKAACTAWMNVGREECEIAFGGFGADETLISDVLGRNPEEYNEEVFDIMERYISFLRRGDEKSISQPEFLIDAIPLFARAAYLRQGPAKIYGYDELKALDATIIDLLNRDIILISEALMQKRNSYKYTVDEKSFVAEYGMFTITSNTGSLVIVLFTGN